VAHFRREAKRTVVIEVTEMAKSLSTMAILSLVMGRLRMVSVPKLSIYHSSRLTITTRRN